MNYFDNLEVIKQKIETCFGANDLKFGVHPLDEARVIEIRESAIINGIKLSDVQDTAFGFLHRNNCTSEDIKVQGIRIIEFFPENSN